jgi:hypothetical protein
LERELSSCSSNASRRVFMSSRCSEQAIKALDRP